MGNEQDLGIRPEVPFLERVAYAVGVVLGILLLPVWNIVYVVLLIFIVSSGIRSCIGKIWLNGLLLIGLWIVMSIWGIVRSKFLDGWFTTLMFGKPVFGKLGGLPRRTFFTIIKAMNLIEFELEDEDLELVKGFNRVRAESIEEHLKYNYRHLVYEPQYGAGNDADLDARWAAIWEEQVLKVRAGNTEFQDALAETNLGFAVQSGNVPLGTQAIDRLLQFFHLLMIFLTARLLSDKIQFLAVVQIGVFLSFTLAIVWYMIYASQMSSIRFMVEFEELPEAIREAFADRFQPFLDREIHPKRVVITKGLFSLLRHYHLWNSLTGILYTLNGLILIGIIFVIGRLLHSEAFDLWYKNMAIALLIIPFFFMLGFYLISVILQHGRQVLAPIIAGLVGALLPYAIEYVYSGEFKLSEAKNAISSVVAGLGILLATTLANHIRKSLEGES